MSDPAAAAAAAAADGAAAAPQPPARRKPMVVIVTGPTAVGKTAISLQLAQRLRGRAAEAEAGVEADAVPAVVAEGGRGEVISADSVQVYRGLDVGSDKLPVCERQGVPHHMIDVRDPLEDFSAGEFFECARPVAEDIVRRGGVPLVVGGTGLYLRWFVVGKGGAPRATPEALAAVAAAMQAAWAAAAEDKARRRQQQQQAAGGEGEGEGEGAGAPEGEAAAASAAAGAAVASAAAAAVAAAPTVTTTAEALAAAAEAAGAAGGLTEDEKWEAAAALLREWGDEVAYARIRAERNNYYRLERALSILAMHPGSRLADFEPKLDAPLADLDYDFRCFFLHRPRLSLYDRIAARVEDMVCAPGGGLLEEAALLLRLGLQPGDNMAAKAIGYRQAMEWLLAARAAGRRVGLVQLAALHAAICQATHKLVRAQMTWFRDDSMYKWVDVEGRTATAVVEELCGELAKPMHEGGCGDSGRLSKEEQKAIMRYRPKLRILTEAATAGAAAAAAKADTAAAAASAAAAPAPAADAASTGATAAAPTPTPALAEAAIGQRGQTSKPFRPKPKSRAQLAAQAAAEAAAEAERLLQPLLDRINDVLLPGLPEEAVAKAAARAAAGKGAGGEGGEEEEGGAKGGSKRPRGE